jgi:DnaJ-class molecular chaperone
VKDYYKILGVSRDADKDALYITYRKLEFLYSVDKNDIVAAERLSEIQEAYDVLIDTNSRKSYDSALKAHEVFQNRKRKIVVYENIPYVDGVSGTKEGTITLEPTKKPTDYWLLKVIFWIAVIASILMRQK